MHYSQFLVASLLGAAAAAPVAGGQEESVDWDGTKWNCEGTTEEADFDDIPASITALTILDVSPITASQIGVYDGLNYKGLFNLDGSILDLTVGGVKPESEANVAVSDNGLLGELLGTTQQFGYPTLTTEGTNTEYFDLKSFYFGCDLDTYEAIAGVATYCHLDVKGTTWDKKTVTASFDYTPPQILDSVLGAPMTQAVLPADFVGLTSVEIDYTATDGGVAGINLKRGVAEVTGLLFLSDNYDYVTYTDCKKPSSPPPYYGGGKPPAYTPAPSYAKPTKAPQPPPAYGS